MTIKVFELVNLLTISSKGTKFNRPGVIGLLILYCTCIVISRTGLGTVCITFVLGLDVPVKNFSVTSGWSQRFLGLTRTVGS